MNYQEPDFEDLINKIQREWWNVLMEHDWSLVKGKVWVKPAKKKKSKCGGKGRKMKG